MDARPVLVAVAPTPAGRDALEVALALALAAGSELEAVATVPLADPRVPRRGATTAMLAHELPAGPDDAALAWAAMRARESGVRHRSTLLAAGDRPRAVAGHARIARPAAVVIGVPRGHAGSRTLRLLRRAVACPVVAVHEGLEPAPRAPAPEAAGPVGSAAAPAGSAG